MKKTMFVFSTLLVMVAFSYAQNGGTAPKASTPKTGSAGSAKPDTTKKAAKKAMAAPPKKDQGKTVG